MWRKLFYVLMINGLVACSSPDQAILLGDETLLDDFESLSIWQASPADGFDIRLNQKNKKNGEGSLEVQFPVGDYPGINSRQLLKKWGKYEALLIDVYNPQKKAVTLTVRLDDQHQKRVNLKQILQPGWNRVFFDYKRIAYKIDAQNIHFIVLFIEKPKQRYTLIFDHLRLQRSGLREGIERAVPQDNQRWGDPLPTRDAVRVELPQAATVGELRVPVARLKDLTDQTPWVSSGLPFAPGQLQDVSDFFLKTESGDEIAIARKVLARWPQDQSIRSVLVQFSFHIPHVFEYVTLVWGQKANQADLEIRPPTWSYPEGTLVLPAQWLSASQVLGEQIPLGDPQFHRYDNKLTSTFHKLNRVALTGDLRKDGFYSTPYVFYQIYTRSGALEHFLAARRELLYYRNTHLIGEGSAKGQSTVGGKPRYIYIEAMLADYLLTGDPNTLDMSKAMAEYLRKTFPPKRAYYAPFDERFWTERMIGSVLNGIVSYWQLTLDPEYKKLAKEYIENLYKTQLAWPSRGGFIHNLYAHDPEEGAEPDEYGGSPFMTGLLLESIINYHRLTWDSTAADVIFRALDWILEEGLVEKQDSFRYLTARKYQNDPGTPDLNLLVVHALGYGYRISGYQRSDYLEVAQKVFDRGVASGFVGRRKHFNQSFRSSGHYLAYVQPHLLKHARLKKTKSKSKSTSPVILENALFAETFEDDQGAFSSGSETKLRLDASQAYLSTQSLRIDCDYLNVSCKVGMDTPRLSFSKHQILRFAYRIPSGRQVGLRVQTAFDDWLCLGGTNDLTLCPNAIAEPVMSFLNNDGQWHEAEFNLPLHIRKRLPGLSTIQRMEWFSQPAKDKGPFLWLDQVRIVPDVGSFH